MLAPAALKPTYSSSTVGCLLPASHHLHQDKCHLQVLFLLPTPQILWWQLFTADFKAELEAADGIFGGSKGAKLREGAAASAGLRLVWLGPCVCGLTARGGHVCNGLSPG